MARGAEFRAERGPEAQSLPVPPALVINTSKKACSFFFLRKLFCWGALIGFGPVLGGWLSLGWQTLKQQQPKGYAEVSHFVLIAAGFPSSISIISASLCSFDVCFACVAYFQLKLFEVVVVLTFIRSHVIAMFLGHGSRIRAYMVPLSKRLHIYYYTLYINNKYIILHVREVCYIFVICQYIIIYHAISLGNLVMQFNGQSDWQKMNGTYQHIFTQYANMYVQTLLAS